MNEILNEATFENQMRGMSDRQLAEFTARQVFDICQDISSHNKRIKKLEERDKKEFGITGGIGAVIGAVLAAIADFVWKKVVS